MAGERTHESVEALERQLLVLRSALETITQSGHVLLQALPIARSVPLALAQGPLMTLTGLAEAALNAAMPQE